MRLLAILFLLTAFAAADPVPQILWGKWTVKRILPTGSISCWDDKQAKDLIGTELEYSSDLFRWNTTVIKNPVAEISTITAEEFHNQNCGRGRYSSQVTFEQLGMKQPKALHIEIEHPPADVIKGTSGIPGASVLLKNQNAIVLSACGVFFEATRITPKRE